MTRRLPALVLLLAGLAASARAQPGSVSASAGAVEAALLLHLVRFATWPEGALGPPSAPITVVVVGPDPFGGTLEPLLAGQRVHGRALVVRRLAALDGSHAEDLAANVVFLTREAVAAGGTRRACQERRGCLVVGEGLDALSAGCHVALALEDRRFRLHVDLDALERGDLTLSAQVLRLAVRHRAPPE